LDFEFGHPPSRQSHEQFRLKLGVLSGEGQGPLSAEAKAHPGGRMLQRPGLPGKVSVEGAELLVEGRLISLVVFDAHSGQTQLCELAQLAATAEQTAAGAIQVNHGWMLCHGLGQEHDPADTSAALPHRELNPLERVAGLGPEHGGHQPCEQEGATTEELGISAIHCALTAKARRREAEPEIRNPKPEIRNKSQLQERGGKRRKRTERLGTGKWVSLCFSGLR
jgi:hypothetical protein